MGYLQIGVNLGLAIATCAIIYDAVYNNGFLLMLSSKRGRRDGRYAGKRFNSFLLIPGSRFQTHL